MSYPFNSEGLSRVLTTTCLLTIITLTLSASTQQSAEEAVKQFHVADGMKVTLFASEPMLRNPTSIDVDAQGRVWVLEATNYRLFNQPLNDEKGDRIRILEDTDGDGKADKATTYYQDPSLIAPLGIAVLGKRVYVCQAPDLFYLEDTDNDGKADKKTVILTGFKGINSDHSLHGIQFGPDGYLYISNGDQGLDVTDGSGHRVQAGPHAPDYIAATVLRTDLEGQHLEILASNMRNPYEPTVDSFGNVYISDNDDDGNEQTRINYVFEGGDYGFRMPDTVSRRKGNRRLDAVHWNEDQPGIIPKMINTGFGSPAGLMNYQGLYLPLPLAGQLIHCDAGPGEVRAFKPAQDGAGKSALMKVLVSAPSDSWFRPVDACAAPDGSVFIADWYDAGVGGHRMADATRGRIYRLTMKGAGETYTFPELDLKTPRGITDSLISTNQARRYLAHEVLKAMDPKDALNEILFNPQVTHGDKYDSGNLTVDIKKDFINAVAPHIFWQMVQMEEIPSGVVQQFLRMDDSKIRIMAVRALSRFAEDNQKLVENHVLNDPDPGVRRQLLLEMAYPYRGDQGKLASRNNPEVYMQWLKALQAHYDGEDRFYREALGIAARGHESKAYAAALEQFATEGWNPKLGGLAFQYHPAEAFGLAHEAAENTNLDFSLRELALRTIDAIGNEVAGEYLVKTALESKELDLQVLAYHLLGRHGGDIWREAMTKHGFDEDVSAALATAENPQGILAFIRATNRYGVIKTLLNTVTTQDLSPDLQVAYLITIESVTVNHQHQIYDEWVKQLTPLLNAKDETVQTATVAAIARLRGYSTLMRYWRDNEKPHASRVKAVRALARDKQSAQELLAIAKAGDLPEDLKFSVADALRNSPASDIQAQAITLFPSDTTRDGKPLPSIKQLVRMKGDSTKGRAVFFDENKSTCSRCHDIASEGKNIGPHLGKIGEKLAKQSLFESILDPNAAISPEYQAWLIDTKDEEDLIGYIRSEDANHLELVDSTGVVNRIPVQSITLRKASPISIMPSGLSAGMTAQELIDLIAFLETLK